MRRALAILILVAIASAAHADPLDRARTLRGQLDFAGALAEVERALAGGGLDRATVIAAYQLEGELAAGLDRADDATLAFEHLLALAPDTTLPAGTSPKIAAPFAAAKTWIAAHGALAAHVVGDSVSIDGDPLQMVAAASRRDTQLVLVDGHGNLLWSGTVIAPPPPPTHHTAWWKHSLAWGALAGACALVAGYEGLREASAQAQWNRLRAEDGQHDYSTLTAVEDRGRAAALVTNLGLAATAITAGVAVAVHF